MGLFCLYTIRMNYVALIRGIGPGNPKMSNANLCRVIESAGCKNVQAIISSGNVIFQSEDTSAALEKTITKALQTDLGIPGFTIVRSQQELQSLLDKKPFGNREHTKQQYLSVTFFVNKPRASLPEVHGLEVVSETGREVCIITEPDILPGPKIMQLLQKTYGQDITTRTWKTVERIVTKLRAQP